MTEKNIVPNLEANASDGNPIFPPRQWFERFRQFTKPKIDITPLLKGEDFTDSKWTEKEAAIEENFVQGVRPEALYQKNSSRIKNGTGHNKKKRPNPVIYRTLLAKTQQIPQWMGFLSGQTIGKRKTGRVLEKHNRIREKM